ncbi:MAG TPA: hypothetical protein EYQ12_03090 [Oceanospirillaceae bacterium]|nr:hypothetical protein [Oceanospirillaceae bacterium]
MPRIPDESSKVVLLDDKNRGVVSGCVTVSGTTVQALTGRNGRGDFLASPRDRLVFDVTGSVGAASAGDRLADLSVALTMQGLDLPTPIHLPDLPDASSSLVASGVQGTPTVLTSTTGDSIVTVGSSVNVTHAGSPDSVTLRIGELSPQHLPGDLLLGGSATVLYGHGVFVHPATATFSPGLDIDLVDDLTLGGNMANLYRLDPDTGEVRKVDRTAVRRIYRAVEKAARKEGLEKENISAVEAFSSPAHTLGLLNIEPISVVIAMRPQTF